MTDSEIVNNIFNPRLAFREKALRTFHFQYEYNQVYRSWNDILKVDIASVSALTKIPFLPISFFKSHRVMTGTFEPELVFESSGTTGSVNSHHYVKECRVYEMSFLKAFEGFYGDVSHWCILGLLPSYLERGNSSLAYMVNRLIQKSNNESSGFYLYDFDQLNKALVKLELEGQSTLLIGVTFALLDFAERYTMHLEHTVVMETGGMKGRRKEITREEVHDILCRSLGIASVHSEYGMTELLSQAYSAGNGRFSCPPWMKILIRDEEDPFLIKETGKGVINVIDLANVHSCSFIATDDVGTVFEDGSFEVHGRIDNSDMRGCSLMLI